MKRPKKSAAGDDPPTGFFWGGQATTKLISLRKVNQKRFDSNSEHDDSVWADIANTLTKDGYPASAEQCKTKFRTHMDQYKNNQDRKKSTGNLSSSFAYGSEMDSLCSDWVNVKPKYLIRFGLQEIVEEADTPSKERKGKPKTPKERKAEPRRD